MKIGIFLLLVLTASYGFGVTDLNEALKASRLQQRETYNQIKAALNQEIEPFEEEQESAAHFQVQLIPIKKKTTIAAERESR